jgi:hypothetical protein
MKFVEDLLEKDILAGQLPSANDGMHLTNARCLQGSQFSGY